MTQVMYPGDDSEKWFDSIEEVHKDATEFRLSFFRSHPSREDFPSRMLIRGSLDKATSVDWSDQVEWIKESISRGDEERYTLNLRLRNGHHVGQFQMVIGVDPLRKLAYERRILAAKAENQGLSDALAGKPPAQAPPPQQQAPQFAGAPQQAPPQQPIYVSNDPAVRQLEQRFSGIESSINNLMTLLDVDGKIKERLQSIGQTAAQPTQQQQAAPMQAAETPQPRAYKPPKGMLVVYNDEGEAELVPASILRNPPSAAMVQHAEAAAKAAATPATPPKGDGLLYGDAGSIEKQTEGVLQIIDRVDKIKERLGVGTPEAASPEPAAAFDPAFAKVGDVNFFRKEDGTADRDLIPTMLANPKLIKESAETVFGAAAEAFIKIQGAQIDNKKKEAEILREREETRKAKAQADAAEADRELKRAQIEETRARTRAMDAQAARAALADAQAPPAEPEPEPATESRQPNGSPVPSTVDAPASSDASLYDN